MELTVKDVAPLLSGSDKISLAYSGGSVPYKHTLVDPLGDYVVKSIHFDIDKKEWIIRIKEEPIKLQNS